MSGVNKVILVGHLGADPEIRATQDGREIARFSLATTETWKSKDTGEKKERTEWHRIVVFSPGLVTVVKNYVNKGSKLYIEGSLQTRKYTGEDNIEKYTTEIVLQGFNCSLTMLDSKRDNMSAPNMTHSTARVNSNDTQNHSSNLAEELEDEIPF